MDLAAPAAVYVCTRRRRIGRQFVLPGTLSVEWVAVLQVV